MNTITQETQLLIPAFGYNVVSGQQQLGKTNGDILERTFDNWTFSADSQVELIQQVPTYYTDTDISSYFSVVRQAIKYQYRSGKELAIGGESVASARNFWGWLQTIDYYNYETVYLNREVAKITWTPVFTPGSSQVIVRDKDNNVLFDQIIDRDRVILKIPDSIWGLRKISGTATATLTDGVTDIIVTTNDVVVPYVSLVLEKTAANQNITLSCRGEIWDRGSKLDYLSSESAEWLYHPNNTAYEQRLTPPNTDVNDSFTPFIPSNTQTIERQHTDWRISGVVD